MASQDRDVPSLPLPPPALPLAALVLAIAGNWLLPLQFLPGLGVDGWGFWLGLVVLLLGLGIGVSGNVAFYRAGTSANPNKPAFAIVTGGAYRFTRNPIYWAFLLIVAGLSLMLSLEWGIILLPLLWLALDRLIVTREEAYLATKFGDAYVAYRRQTRRWL